MSSLLGSSTRWEFELTTDYACCSHHIHAGGAKRPSPRPRVADGAAAATRGGCSICCGLTRLPEWLSPLSQCAVVVRAAAASRGCCSCSCQRGRRHGLALGLESRHSAWWWPGCCCLTCWLKRPSLQPRVVAVVAALVGAMVVGATNATREDQRGLVASVAHWDCTGSTATACSSRFMGG